jgi:hypothetical protein
MNKVFFVLLFFVSTICGFAQTYDDLPFTNPDPMTYFQQEMTSLMRFQIKNDINIPFFLSLSVDGRGNNYSDEKMRSIASEYDYGASGSSSFLGSPDFTAAATTEEFLIGVQFKINPSFYIPLFFFGGSSSLADYADESWWRTVMGTDGTIREKRHELAYATGWKTRVFPGAGLFINTDTFKGGVYLGIQVNNDAYADRKFLMNSETNSNVSETSNIIPKIAFLPIVNTSNWTYVGKVLDHFMGFIGYGDVVYTSEEEGDSKFSMLISTINLLLDFSFNKMHFDYIILNSRAYYQRDNYDVFAKTDTFALELRGGFPTLPLGFIVNGGYKHFYSFHPDIPSAYHDTFFINGSVYVIIGSYGNLGFTYRYDDVTKAKYIFAFSTNFLSGFFGFNPSIKTTRKFDGQEVETESGMYRGFGIRYRHGGWRIK